MTRPFDDIPKKTQQHIKQLIEQHFTNNLSPAQLARFERLQREGKHVSDMPEPIPSMWETARRDVFQLYRIE